MHYIQRSVIVSDLQEDNVFVSSPLMGSHLGGMLRADIVYVQGVRIFSVKIEK